MKILQSLSNPTFCSKLYIRKC